jgi:predicted PurR-regulated permease PerM
MEKTGRATLIFFLIILVASSLASLWMIRLFFVSVMVGGLLAMMTKTYYVKLNNRKIWPSISAFLVTIGIILLVIIPFSIFVAVAAKQGVQIGKSLAQSGSFSLESVVNWIASWPGVSLLGIAPEDLSVSLLDWLETGAKSATSFAVGFVAQIPDALLQLALACIACYFFLVDGGKFLDWMRSRVPLDKDVRNRVVSSFESMAVASVWATLAAGAAQSAVIFTSFLILGVQGAFLAAGATFLYTRGAFGKVALMILFGLFAGIVDNILRPIVLRGRSDMHPLISLVSIFGGLAWFGIMGVFIGPLLAAVTLSLLEAWPDVANRYGLGYGREPGDAD